MKMSIRERVLSAYRKEDVDIVPFIHYESELPRKSKFEREARNLGMGIFVYRAVFDTWMPNVKTEDQYMPDGSVKRTFKTPIGDVYIRFKWEGIQYELLGYPDVLSRTAIYPFYFEHLIKRPEDYDVVEYMIKDRVYKPNPEPFLRAEREIGDEGIVVSFCDRTPLKRFLMELAGYVKGSIDYYMHRDRVEHLIDAIKVRLREEWRIIADSPGEVVWLADNIDGLVDNPLLFEKYCLPAYREITELLHNRNKILLVHMDGRIHNLIHLIAETDIDVIEALTPPPICDLPLKEARKIWPEKAIQANFPESVCFEGADSIKHHTIDILKSISPGDGFVLAITESIPSELHGSALRTISRIMSKARFPLKF